MIFPRKGMFEAVEINKQVDRFMTDGMLWPSVVLYVCFEPWK